VAAKYAYPYESHAFDSSEFIKLDFTTMLKVLSDNKVLLTFYENVSKELGLEVPSRLRTVLFDALDKGRMLIIDMDSKIRELDSLLKKNNLRYLLPKYTFFHREQNDIDILVPEEDFHRILKLLQSQGFRATSIQSPWKVTLARWVDNRRNSVHVHSRLHWYPWDPLEFVPSEDLWQGAQAISLVDSTKVLIPSAEDCVLVLAAHAMFENHSISLADVFQLSGIVREFGGIKWSEIADKAYAHGWSSDLLVFLESANYLSLHFYRQSLVPKAIFSYVEKKTRSAERVVRRLVGKTNASTIPYRYPFAQASFSFVKVVLRKYGSSAIFKIPNGFVHRTVYQINRARGIDPSAVG
jgi:putative nucleotidyltransferase-like protein